VNRHVHDVDVADDATLATVLRDTLGLTGTKVACNQAACGACTVLLDGRAVFSCHLLAAQVGNRAVETVENLAHGEALHPLQTAFVEHDALQCGFCTSGMLMAIIGARNAHGEMNREQLIRAISGNLCRCGAYAHIIDAALSVILSEAKDPAVVMPRNDRADDHQRRLSFDEPPRGPSLRTGRRRGSAWNVA
jgi:xanthine dehydrogenase YagT iron-sulfur-binding subunit